MKLKDVLMKRPEGVLYQMVHRRDLSTPGVTDPEDVKQLYQLYDQDEEDRDLLIREFEEPIELRPASKRMSKKEKEDRQKLKEFYAQRSHAGELLLEVKKRKEEYAEILADELLKRDNAQAFLLSLHDEVGQVMEDILSGRIIPDEEGFFPISVLPEDKYGFEASEKAGYTLIRRTDWREEEDERVHFTGIMISQDALSLFREIETKELVEKRILYNALKKCCALAGSYYTVASFSLIYRLYQVLRKEDPDRYPDPDEAEFEQLMLEFCGKIDPSEQMVHYHGINYVSSLYEQEELTDEVDPDESITASLIIKQQECGYDFYIPSAAEIKDNYRKGFSCEKKCFLDLEQFVREAYLDEKYMSDMQSSMFRMVINDPEDDWGKKSYSMDMVEQNTEGHMADLLFGLKDGYGPLNTFRDEKNFYAPFREEAKERYRELLIACHEEMNEPWFLGHTNREVQEQGFDDPWDLNEPENDGKMEKEED